MKIVINIPKEQYTTLNAKTQDDIVDVVDHGTLIKAIKNGTPLPEGQYDCRTIDRVLEIIDEVSHKASARGQLWTTEKTIRVLRREVLALKGEQE